MRVIDELTWFTKQLNRETTEFGDFLERELSIRKNLKLEEELREKAVKDQMGKVIILKNMRVIVADSSNSDEYFIVNIGIIDITMSKPFLYLKKKENLLFDAPVPVQHNFTSCIPLKKVIIDS